MNAEIPQPEDRVIKLEPGAVYIRMYVDKDNNLNSDLWMETDSYELAAVVRGMLARLEVDQHEWMEVGEYILNKEAKKIEHMITKGNA